MRTHKLLEIDIATINWTEGDAAGFGFMILPGCTITIDWGDNRCDVIKVFGNESEPVFHRYRTDLREKSYYSVCVYSDNPDAIIGLSSSTIDMEILRVDTSGCRSLKHLHFIAPPTLDLSANTELESLEIKEYGDTSFDLSHCSKLRDLNLDGAGQLKSLSLTKNLMLENVSLRCCFNLTKVSVSNNACFRSFSYESTPISEKYLRWINLQHVSQNGTCCD